MKITHFDNHNCRLTPPPCRTPANIRLCLIFLDTRFIDLHSTDDSLGLSSFNVFWWGL